jgi:hypothetical protein
VEGCKSLQGSPTPSGRSLRTLHIAQGVGEQQLSCDSLLVTRHLLFTTTHLYAAPLHVVISSRSRTETINCFLPVLGRGSCRIVKLNFRERMQGEVHRMRTLGRLVNELAPGDWG